MFNLGTHAKITSNATCGEQKSEVYCTLTEDGESRRCGVCDSSEEDRSHPPHLALDGSDRWWQSPTLQYSPAYQQVTITINLKRIYQVAISIYLYIYFYIYSLSIYPQVAYIILIAGVSPRPASWVLERSLDGVTWQPWQVNI